MNRTLIDRAVQPLFSHPASAPAPFHAPGPLRLAELGVSTAWQRKNPTFALLQQHYAPANWGRMMADPSKAYTWVCPTVGALDELYGPASAQQWMDQQVTALFLTSASREGSAASVAIGAFVSAFTASVSGYKLSELMLFFARYKAGLYDRSFAAFDVRRIGLAFHHEFLPERRRELGTVGERLEAERAVREREERQRHAISYDRFHRAARSTPYGMLLTFRLPPEAPQMRKVCRYLHLSDPYTEPQVQLTLTRQQMRMVARWTSLGWLAVDDSWEL